MRSLANFRLQMTHSDLPSASAPPAPARADAAAASAAFAAARSLRTVGTWSARALFASWMPALQLSQ